MFPHRGRGFIWDTASINGERAETTLFVPDSKKLFSVAVSTKDVHKDKLLPKEWIEWEGVGARDASKPIQLIGVSPLDPTVERPIHPEYTNQTTFRSVLLFPDREDLVEFVGENNAWSPYVGVVKCDDPEVTRGAYCVGYIVRDYSKPESAFLVNEGSLKFPEGYMSDRHQKIFEGLSREIELAAEEERILASKGKTADVQIIPTPKKPEYDDDVGGFETAQYGENPRVVRTTDVNRPGWSKFKTPDEIAYIEYVAAFIKNRRVHDIIVYKLGNAGRGFVGYTPLLGSVPIYADSHKITGQRVEIGMNLQTRIEYNKRKKEFVVESVAEIAPIPFIGFKIRKNKKRVELVIKCPNLDLNDFKQLEGKEGRWKGKKVGVIEHPSLLKVLVPEEYVHMEEWKGKKVRAKLVHYEGINKDNCAGIRLILEKIEGLFEDGVSKPLRVSMGSGIPDSVDSDVDNDDEGEEVEEGGGAAADNEEEEGEDEGPAAYYEDNRELGRMGEKPPTNAFAPIDNYSYGGGGFNTNTSFNQQRLMREQTPDNGGGYGRSERGGGNGGRGRGGGGVLDNHSSSYSSRPPSDHGWPQEGHGFGPTPSHRIPLILDRGMLVCCSTKSSIFYTEKKRIVEYFGDARNDNMRLGDSAEFEIETSNSLIPFTVIGYIQRVPDFFPVDISVTGGEVYVRLCASLTPHRNKFECVSFVSHVDLGPSQDNLKLRKGDFIEKSRIKVDHQYHIVIKFSMDELLMWKFDCIDNTVNSFEVEEMDEIDLYKRQNMERDNKEKIQSRGPSSRSGDEDWKRVDKNDRQSKFSIPSRHPSQTPSIISGSTRMTSTTMTTEKEMRNLRKENDALKRMLKNVWGYKPVQQTVKQDNYFLYESVDDCVKGIAEDESEVMH